MSVRTEMFFLALTLALAPLTVLAAEVTYTQPVGGVYTQTWRIQTVDAIDDYASGPHRLYVEGQGKLGTFHGVLSLDCPRPDRSHWLLATDYLGSDDVPAEPIRAIRNALCAAD